MWNLYQQVCREEQPLWRWLGVKAGGRQQQVVQSFPSSVAQVVEWTWCFCPCSAGGAGRAEHQPGLSQNKQVESVLHIFEIFSGDPRQVFFFSHFVVSFQLVDMQWKLGMAVSSDTCRSLNSPYVSLRLKILEPSGQICHRSFEMTVPQFQVCMLYCSCSVIGVVK